MQKETFRKCVQGGALPDFFRLAAPGDAERERVFFLCIGTDRSTGDALGPLTGSFLAERGFTRLIGTLAAPCDSDNLQLRLNEVPPDAILIVVDACLGQENSVGMYQIADGPLEPGKSVGKRLPPVGDYSVAAIVNAAHGRTYSVLQHTSLNTVIRMAREIANAAFTVFGKG